MVTLYSTHCPKCKVLEKKLVQSGLEHQIIDDKDAVIAKGQEVGILSAPILITEDNAYKFEDAVKFLNASIPNITPCASCNIGG